MPKNTETGLFKKVIFGIGACRNAVIFWDQMEKLYRNYEILDILKKILSMLDLSNFFVEDVSEQSCH